MQLRMMIYLLALLAVLGAHTTHAELKEMKDLYRRIAVREFHEPKTAAWVYTAALKRGKSLKYFYAGLTTSISSLQQHGTKWPIVVILDGDGVGPEVHHVLKALGVAQVLEVGKDLLPHHPRYGQVIETANNNAPEHYFGCFNKIWAWALTDYEKVVSVDLDVVFWRNPDDAMFYPELSAVNDYGMSLGSPSIDWHKAFQAGIMVIQPYNKTFFDIAHILAEHIKGHEDLGGLPEQHILNEYWNLRWFELPVGFNIQPTQIPYEAYKGVYSIHHVAWWKDDFYRSLDRCETEVDCKECCRRAVKARMHGLERLEAAGLAKHFAEAHST